MLQERIPFRLGWGSEPICMLSWSPSDNYLLLSYEGACKIKVYELRDNRTEDWQFDFDLNPLATSIQHALWSPDECTLLLHPKGTN